MSGLFQSLLTAAIVVAYAVHLLAGRRLSTWLERVGRAAEALGIPPILLAFSGIFAVLVLRSLAVMILIAALPAGAPVSLWVTRLVATALMAACLAVAFSAPAASRALSVLTSVLWAVIAETRWRAGGAVALGYALLAASRAGQRAQWSERTLAVIEFIPARILALPECIRRRRACAESYLYTQPIVLGELAAMVGVLLSAGGLRVQAALASAGAPLGPDEGNYLMAARLLREKGRLETRNPIFPHGPPTRASRMPLYPAYLAACAYIAGPAGIRLARLGQLEMELLTCLFVFGIARAMSGRVAALAGAALQALHPALAAQSARLLTETPAALLLTVAAYLMLRAAAARRATAWYCCAGLAVGLATLVRPDTLLFGLVLLPILPWLWRPRLHGLLCAFAFCAAMGIVMAPWAWRNQRLFGRTVWGTTHAGYNLWQGNTIKYGGMQRWAARAAAARVLEREGIDPRDEAGIDRALMREGLALMWRDLTQRPLAYARLIGRKARLLFRPTLGGLQVVGQAVLIGALFGILICATRPRHSVGLLLLPVYSVALHLLTFAEDPRYLVPITPILTVLAGLTVAFLVRPPSPSMHS